MATEPARIITAITAFVTAVLGLVSAFGLGLTDDQRNAILGVIGPTVVLIIVAGELIRSKVVSPKAAGEAVGIAKRTDPASPVIDNFPRRAAPAAEGPR